MSGRHTLRATAAVMLWSCSALAAVASPPRTAAEAVLPGHIRAGAVLRDVQIAGVGGVPGDAVAVFANVTMTQTDSAGYLSISPEFTSAQTSVVNVTGRGRTASNLALLSLDPDGQLDIASNGGTDVVIDVLAALTSSADVRPDAMRVVDTRLGADTGGRLAPMVVRAIPLGDAVRPDSTVAIVNLTATNAVTAGYISVVPCSATGEPATSNNNVDSRTSTRSVLAFAPIQHGDICVVSQQAVDLVVDVEGDATAAGIELLPGGPQRFLDTRAGTRFTTGEARELAIADALGDSNGGAPVLLGTMTATDMVAPGWASVGPSASNGTFSSLNFADARPTPNAFVAASSGGNVIVQSSQAGNLIVDGVGMLRTTGTVVLPAPARVLDTRLGNPPPPNPLGSCVPGPPIAGVRLPSGVKALAFTFDDGPDSVNTRIIMNAFRAHGLEGRAMFFWIGQNIGSRLDVAREVIDRGYAVGDHGYTASYSPSVIVSGIAATNDIITDLSGTPVSFFRAPGLTRSPLIDEAMRRYGMCDLFTRSNLDDWTIGPDGRVPADQLVRNAMYRIKNGDFVLLHDGGSHIETARAIGRILDWAIASGYRIVTPTELLSMGQPILYGA